MVRWRYTNERMMERIAKKSKSFAEADAWDREQHRQMTPTERMAAGRAIKNRLFPGKQPDVRECHLKENAA